MSQVQSFRLSNGIKVLFQKTTGASSVSVGLWVRIGSRHENDQERGYTHFLEHMLFKGTEKRTPKQIAEDIERVGGYLNAATSREYTYFYATLIKEKLELALDVLSDMVFASTISEKEVRNESSVILEELLSYQENPEDYIHDYFYRNFLPNSSLGFDIVGNKDSVSTASSQKVKKYYKKYYVPERMNLVIVGDLEFGKVKSYVEKYFSDFQQKGKTLPMILTPKKSFTSHLERRKIEQTQIILGLEGVKKDLNQAVLMSLFSHILGGGMSSRLFQSIREEKGLCYSISSYSSAYEDTGVFSIYCGTSNSKFLECVQLILKELRRLKQDGFTSQELSDAKSNQIGNLAIACETPDSKMTDIALQEIYFQKFFTIKDRSRAIQNVTLAQLNAFANQILQEKVHLSVLGNVSEKSFRSLDLSL
jgi:predicted Zn-dependent peptidase